MERIEHLLRAIKSWSLRGLMAGYFLSLMMVATLILFGFGGFFVYDSVSHTGLSQFPEVIGGALLLALGLTLLYSQAKLAVRWLHAVRTEHHRNS